MCHKIQYDNECEKFCKIFWELNKKLERWLVGHGKKKEPSTHASSVMSSPPRPATGTPELH